MCHQAREPSLHRRVVQSVIVPRATARGRERSVLTASSSWALPRLDELHPQGIGADRAQALQSMKTTASLSDWFSPHPTSLRQEAWVDAFTQNEGRAYCAYHGRLPLQADTPADLIDTFNSSAVRSNQVRQPEAL